MASGSTSGGGGSRLRRSTPASRRTVSAWNPSMSTPF